MPINSRAKGKRFELAWRDRLKEYGFEARRGAQFSGSNESPDVVANHPGWHAEVKAVEKLNIETAMLQAIRDAGENLLPYVAHKRNKTPWRVTVDSDTFLGLLEYLRINNVRGKRDPHTGRVSFTGTGVI